MESNNSNALKMQTLLSKLTLAFGVLLVTFKIYADSEPGAIPLLISIIGAGWYLLLRFKLRAKGQTE